MGSFKKYPWIFVSFVALALAGCDNAGSGADSSDQEPAAAAAELEGDVAKASYSIGFTMAENLQSNFADSIDVEAFIKGVRDKFGDQPRAVSMEEARLALTALAEQQAEAMADRALANLSEGEAFLAENSAREGVVTLESGLQYEILETGEGAKPGPTDVVTTHYVGTLVDGTEFDSSYGRGEPASFPLNGVIPGWTEALQLMPVGSKWRLYVPAALAYGDQDRGPIPANSTLIFDVELLDIERAEEEPAAAEGS